MPAAALAQAGHFIRPLDCAYKLFLSRTRITTYFFISRKAAGSRDDGPVIRNHRWF
jgi:hypothetical protein